jgi:hypothetical protein
MTQTAIAPSLYESDFSLWLEETAARLKARDFDRLDINNLVDEIETLGRSERHELKNCLDVMLSHVLKRLCVNLPNDYNGWERTIREQRKQIKRRLADSPSLKSYLPEIFDQVWQDALAEVQEDYPQYQFPDRWEFSRDVDALLTEAFWE